MLMICSSAVSLFAEDFFRTVNFVFPHYFVVVVILDHNYSCVVFVFGPSC